MTQRDAGFLAGVIEGFYGQPWTEAERLQLFDLMAAWGLDTYVYAAKDDPKHRACWREPYAPAEAGAIAATDRRVTAPRHPFRLRDGPGSTSATVTTASSRSCAARVEQLLSLGLEHVALLFDDSPHRLDPAVLARWGSLAMAQCHVANAIFAWTRERRPEARGLLSHAVLRPDGRRRPRRPGLSRHRRPGVVARD